MAISKEVKETITTTIDEVFEKMNHIAWIDRHQQMQKEAFKNTEKLLYSLKALEEHIADEEGYFTLINKGKSGSVVRYTKNKVSVNEDQILKDRIDSYHRSKSDLERINKALKKVNKRKDYAIIELRYFLVKDEETNERYTWEEIAEKLAGKYGFSENLNEKTVRNRKNKIVQEIAVLLFGSDAI